MTYRDKLVLYLKQVKPLVLRENRVTLRWDEVMNKDPLSYDKDSTWPKFRRAVEKLMPGIEQLGVDYAAITPPEQLVKAHDQIVASLRATDSLGNAYLDALQYGSNQGDAGFKRLRAIVEKANALYRDWAFAVQVEARRQHVKIPFDITQNE
jgi:hypothetical protein